MAMVDMSIELLFLGLKHRQTLPIIIIDRSIVYCPDWVLWCRATCAQSLEMAPPSTVINRDNLSPGPGIVNSFIWIKCGHCTAVMMPEWWMDVNVMHNNSSDPSLQQITGACVMVREGSGVINIVFHHSEL